MLLASGIVWVILIVIFATCPTSVKINNRSLDLGMGPVWDGAARVMFGVIFLVVFAMAAFALGWVFWWVGKFLLYPFLYPLSSAMHFKL